MGKPVIMTIVYLLQRGYEMKRALAIVLMMAFIMTTGCAAKDDKESGSTLNITFESYGLVSLGMSYKKVCDTLGAESTTVADSFAFPLGMGETEKSEFAGARYYSWYELDSKGNTITGNSIAVAIINGTVVAKRFRSNLELSEITDPISVDQFRELEFGMSYKGVADIAGNPMVCNYDYVDKNQHVVCYSQGVWPEWEFIFEFSNDKMIYKYLANHMTEDYSQHEISEAVLAALRVGMSYGEVCSITGSEGCFMYEEATRYTVTQAFVWWYDAQMTFYFVDGYLYDYEGGTDST